MYISEGINARLWDWAPYVFSGLPDFITDQDIETQLGVSQSGEIPHCRASGWGFKSVPLLGESHGDRVSGLPL